MGDSDDILKEKFKKIEKKQNEKLLNRNKARVEKENSTKKQYPPDSSNKDSFGVKDELDLKVSVTAI